MEALSLQSILEAFNVPLNEEQAWAVCYQSAKYLQNEWQVSGPGKCHCFNGVSSLELSKEGTVEKIHTNSEEPAEVEYELVQSLGVVIFHALDFGLPESDEQKLSPTLEQLIEKMTVSDSDDEAETRNKQIDVDGDEGIEHDEEEEFVVPKLTLEGVLMMCTAHLSAGLEPGVHYKAVCRALATEAMELLTFLDNIGTEKSELAGAMYDQLDGAKLEDLKRSDWTCLWRQILKQLRNGIKLKKVEHVDHLPTEYELTPYEILMEDIRSRRYTLNKVNMDERIPALTKKDAHTVILDFIRSRPPLHPAKERKLKSPPPKTVDVREDMLEAIRKEPKLKPTPGRMVETSRTKLNEDDATPLMTRKVIKADPLLLLSNSFDEDDLDEDTDEEEDVFSPNEDQRKVPVSVMPSILSPLTPLSPRTPPTSPWQQKIERNLATGSACFGSTDRRHSITVCESPARERAPSGLPVSPRNVPPLSALHPSVLDSELTNTNYRSVQSSLECLSLTIDEVMHIRNVLTKAELECLLVNPELHELVFKGKVCFTCKVTKFSLFGIWATKCKFCQRNVCTKCVSKMRIPTEHFEHIPVYTLSPSPMSPGYKNFDYLFPYEKTGSVPSSPVFNRKSLSPQPDVVNNNQGDGDNLQRVRPPKKLKFHSPQSGQELRKVSEESSMKGGRKNRPLQRSQTVTRPPPPRQLQGPVMNICKDCKAMVINVIRASRTSLAKAPKFGITTQNFVDMPPSKPSRNFTLDLKPVYGAK